MPSPLPLPGLPVEIFGRIFEFATVWNDPRNLPNECYSQIYRLAHVCHQWREIVMSWTPLFTCLDLQWLRKRSMTDVWIQRSGQRLLDVYSGEDDLDVIQRIAPRIRYLHYEDIFKPMEEFHQLFKRLEVFYVVGMHDDISDWNLPALRQLSISGNLHRPISPITFSLSPSMASRIQFLSLRETQSVHGIYQLLASMERLEALELSGVRWKAPELRKEEEYGKWQSTSLRHLSITGSRRNSLAGFFREWSCPSLETFYYNELDSQTLWDPHRRNHDVWSAARLFLERSPRIHTLTWDLHYLPSASPSPFPELASRLDLDSPDLPLFPALQTIRLFGTTSALDKILPGLDEFIRTLQNRHLKHGVSSTLTPPLHPDPTSRTSLSQPSPSKAPIRLEIESSKLLRARRKMYEELVESVEQISNPSRLPHPDWHFESDMYNH